MLSNDIIINFGNYINGTNIFPLAYSQACFIATSGDYNWDVYDNGVYVITLQNFSAFREKSNICTNYIAIGI